MHHREAARDGELLGAVCCGKAARQWRIGPGLAVAKEALRLVLYGLSAPLTCRSTAKSPRHQAPGGQRGGSCCRDGACNTLRRPRLFHAAWLGTRTGTCAGSAHVGGSCLPHGLTTSFVKGGGDTSFLSAAAFAASNSFAFFSAAAAAASSTFAASVAAAAASASLAFFFASALAASSSRALFSSADVNAATSGEGGGEGGEGGGEGGGDGALLVSLLAPATIPPNSKAMAAAPTEMVWSSTPEIKPPSRRAGAKARFCCETWLVARCGLGVRPGVKASNVGSTHSIRRISALGRLVAPRDYIGPEKGKGNKQRRHLSTRPTVKPTDLVPLLLATLLVCVATP